MSLVVWIGGSVLLVLLIIMFFVKWDNGYCDDWSDGGYVLVLFFVVLFFVLAWGCFGNWKEKKVRIYPDIEYNEETRLVKVKCKYDNLTYTGGLNKSYLNSEFDETFTKDTKWFIEESFNHFGRSNGIYVNFENTLVVDSTKIRKISYKKPKKEKPEDNSTDSQNTVKERKNIIEIN